MLVEVAGISYYAGVDLGGTKTAVAVGDGSAELLVTRTFETRGDRGPDAVLADVARIINELGSGVSLAGIGVGVPGLCDPSEGKVLFCPNLTGYWRGVPAAGDACQILRRCTRFSAERCSCGNILRVPVREPARSGHDSGHRGEPVSAVESFGGQLQLGRFGAAGEIGHQTIVQDGVICGCGNRGCLETVASGPALTAEALRLLRIGLAPKLRQLART